MLTVLTAGACKLAPIDPQTQHYKGPAQMSITSCHTVHCHPSTEPVAIQTTPTLDPFRKCPFSTGGVKLQAACDPSVGLHTTPSPLPDTIAAFSLEPPLSYSQMPIMCQNPCRNCADDNSLIDVFILILDSPPHGYDPSGLPGLTPFSPVIHYFHLLLTFLCHIYRLF